MFKTLISKYKEQKKAKKIKQLEKKLSISFDGYGTINKLVISEFNGILQNVLKNANLDFNLYLEKSYFSLIAVREKEILRAIATEIQIEELKENKAYNYLSYGTVDNLKNLESIVMKIVAYQRELKAIKWIY